MGTLSAATAKAMSLPSVRRPPTTGRSVDVSNEADIATGTAATRAGEGVVATSVSTDVASVKPVELALVKPPMVTPNSVTYTAAVPVAAPAVVRVIVVAAT